jgi:hypothetical protein
MDRVRGHLAFALSRAAVAVAVAVLRLTNWTGRALVPGWGVYGVQLPPHEEAQL